MDNIPASFHSNELSNLLPVSKQILLCCSTCLKAKEQFGVLAKSSQILSAPPIKEDKTGKQVSRSLEKFLLEFSNISREKFMSVPTSRQYTPHPMIMF